MRIGILGGTFDPPHIGHLIIAEQVREKLNLAEVWFIPTNKPPHKNPASSTVCERLEMLELAIKDNPYFKVNTIEIERTGVSYSIDTLTELEREHPHHSFYFIIGADMVEYLPKWYKIDALLEIVTFVGVKRPNYQLKTALKIKEVVTPEIDISSSYIREQLKQGQVNRYLLPNDVYTYIMENKLYGYR